MKKTKMSMFSCIMMAVGTIIGAGAFTYIPAAIGFVGDQILWAIIIAAVYVALKQLPSTYMQSALPVSASSYVYLAKFIHPTAGLIQVLNSSIGTLNVVVMSNTFALYAAILFGQSGNTTFTMFVAAAVAIIIATAGFFGARMSGNLENIIVGILVVALGVYIIGGFGYESATPVAISDMLIPTFEFASIWAAVGYLNYALSGGSIVASFADEVENPGFIIPVSFIAGITIVAVLYMLIAIVTLNAGPLTDDATTMNAWILGEQAAKFLSPTLLAFFLTGGAMFATMTTLNGSFMMYSRLIYAAARDGIWPKALMKTNKYNVPYVALAIVLGIGLFFIFTGIPTTQLMSMTTIPALLMAFVYYIPIVIFDFKYPHCAKNAWFRLPRWLNYALVAFAVWMSFNTGLALLKNLDTSLLLGMITFYALGVIYYVCRLLYLKKHGIDLIEMGRTPIESWEKREAELKAIAEGTAPAEAE